MTYKILNTIGEVYSPEARPTLESLGSVTYATPAQDELERIIGDYDILVVGLGLAINTRVIDAGAKLKIVATATTGLDHIDLAYAKERGVPVVSLKGEDAFLDTITGTTELALALALMLSRQLPAASAAVARGEWRREDFRGHNLSERTLGVVGLGRLGRMLAHYGTALGMRVLYSDPNAGAGAHPEYEKVSLAELLRESDVVSIHVHLSPLTEHMFNAAAFEEMRPGAYLINTSRDKIVDEAALLAALKVGQLAGYGTDVLSGEIEFAGQIPNTHPLWSYSLTHPNVIIVPHIGGMTEESRIKTDVFIAEKLRAALS